MKKMVERTFCDMPLCAFEARAVCSSCERDICESHRNWVSTQFMHGVKYGQTPGGPAVAAPPATGFNLCHQCTEAMEAVFVRNRRRGDGFGPMPPKASP